MHLLLNHSSRVKLPYHALHVELGPLGKWFASSISDRQGLIVGIIGLWSLPVLRPSNERLMSRLLGRLEWALRPNAGVSAFLARAC